MDKGFRSNTGTGFAVTFPNGWSVSVQWREGNYASLGVGPNPTASTVETMVFSSFGDNLVEEDPQGWQTPEQVLATMNEVAARAPAGGFDAWMAKVDAIIIKKTGLSYLDLPDYCYADEYEDGATPLQAAKLAIAAADYF